MIDRRAFVASSAAASLGGLAWPGTASAALASSITFGPVTPIYTLALTAMEKGYFKDEGVDFKLVSTDAGARSRQTLAAGDSLLAHGDASHPLQLSNRGKKSKIILATQMVASISNIVIRKDLHDQGIKTIEALADWKRPDGAKPIVAATAIGSGTWMYGTYVFERRNLGGRVNWVAGGGTKTMLAGLQSKQFDAIMAVPGWQIEAEKNGFGVSLYDVRTPGLWERDFGGLVPVLVVYCLEETIDKQPDAVQATVNALYRTMKWIKSSPVDDVYALIGQKHFGSLDAASAKVEIAFDKDTWAYDGRVKAADFERGGRVWYRQGSDIQPTTFEAIVDMRFLDAAQKKY